MRKEWGCEGRGLGEGIVEKEVFKLRFIIIKESRSWSHQL